MWFCRQLEQDLDQVAAADCMPLGDSEAAEPRPGPMSQLPLLLARNFRSYKRHIGYAGVRLLATGGISLLLGSIYWGTAHRRCFPSASIEAFQKLSEIKQHDLRCESLTCLHSCGSDHKRFLTTVEDIAFSAAIRDKLWVSRQGNIQQWLHRLSIFLDK